MMENNYIFLLTLTGFSYQYEWLRNGNRRALLIGSGAFGLNLLTRLTTGMDLLAGASFLLLVLWLEGVRGRHLWNRCRTYIATAFPVYMFFGLHRPPISVLPLRIVLQYLHQRGRSRSQAARSGSARQLSLRNPLPRRLFRRALRPGEVDLSLRSFADSHDSARRRRVEAVQPGRQGIRDR